MVDAGWSVQHMHAPWTYIYSLAVDSTNLIVFDNWNSDMDIIDIKTYMQSIGREARAASRLIAKAETAAKNRALDHMATAIKRDEQRLLEANAGDVENARAKGLDPAMIDRLTLTSKSIGSMAEGLLQIAALADPVGEISDLNAGAARRGRHHLRSAA
jgi:hypothetical protein